MTENTGTDPAHPEWPGLYRACVAISLDNGGINRGRPIEDQRTAFDLWAAKHSPFALAPLDAWLGTLNPKRMELVASGGWDEPATIAAKEGAPSNLDEVLNNYFDEVC